MGAQCLCLSAPSRSEMQINLNVLVLLYSVWELLFNIYFACTFDFKYFFQFLLLLPRRNLLFPKVPESWPKSFAVCGRYRSQALIDSRHQRQLLWEPNAFTCLPGCSRLFTVTFPFCRKKLPSAHLKITDETWV